MNTQNSAPMSDSRKNRALRPRSLAIARARAVNHLGRRISEIEGSGRRTSASGIQDLDELSRRVLARETQEDLLESFRPRFGAAPQLLHRAARADGSVRDDSHTIAHLLRDLERVRAHHDRVPA